VKFGEEQFEGVDEIRHM